ncbi:MAG: glycosyltransferase family 1 protein [Chitinophagales bacterium]|nr:glycosyltransferase family 1 protein [Chitinophagales bacterium]
MVNSRLTTHDLQLNIICFDVPYPADYGGAIEEFYKIKALYQLGVKIHLHCFIYGDRKEQNGLDMYCEKVYYYKRERSIKDIFSNLPFIVKSRMKDNLLANLLSNDYPILFDATHTTGFLNHPKLKERKKIVRLHNIEWIYYRILLLQAVSLKEKIFFYQEYKKLKEYDKQLIHADVLSCLSQTDYEYYQEKFPDNKVSLDSVFHENNNINSIRGKGDYILYHGNLSLSDNYSLIIQLLSNELKSCSHKIVLTGKNPHITLQQFVKGKNNIELIPNPTDEILNGLMKEAHICLAMAANPSGVKLKLINSLFNARFVISNEAALTGSGLDSLVYIAEENDLPDLIDKLMLKEFKQEEIDERNSLLSDKYNNLNNAHQIINQL